MKFSNSVDEIKSAIDECVKRVPQPYAAFDADGTLWATDMGEVFFDYQIRNKLIEDMPPEPWDYYRKLKQENREKAYLWLAQINSGQSLETLQGWTAEAVNEAQPVPVFEFQKAIIKHLKSLGVRVYIVTASIKWAVEPAANLFELEFDDVIGVCTKVKDDIVTDRSGGPVSYGEGKVEALLKKTEGVRPFFCSGNTMGDLPLLRAATDLKFTVALSEKNSKLYKTEHELLEIAKTENWFWVAEGEESQ